MSECKQSLSPILLPTPTNEGETQTHDIISTSNLAANVILDTCFGGKNRNNNSRSSSQSIVWKISHDDNNDNFKVIINYLRCTRVKCQANNEHTPNPIYVMSQTHNNYFDFLFLFPAVSHSAYTMFVFLFIDFTVAFLFHNLHNAAHRVRFVMFCLQMCCFFSHTRRATASIVVIILYVNIIICCVHKIIAKREEKRVLKICLKTILFDVIYTNGIFSRFFRFFSSLEK